MFHIIISYTIESNGTMMIGITSPLQMLRYAYNQYIRDTVFYMFNCKPRMDAGEMLVRRTGRRTTNTNEVQMCLQLLKKNPLKRLGAGEKDANEVKGDQFFQVKSFHRDFVYF